MYRNPYLEACIEEMDGDAAFLAKALGDITSFSLSPWPAPAPAAQGIH